MCCLTINKATAQLAEDSTTLNRKRLNLVVATSALTYTASMVGLYQIWYKGTVTDRFRFFNDDDEWLQMDKIGHSFTSYYEGYAGYKMLKWTGLNDRKCIIYGGLYGMYLQTTLEIFDGFNDNWGFSWGDIGTNALGTGLFIGQQLAFDKQIVKPKFSYHSTYYAKLNPNLLGDNALVSSLKDYNGQTYWISYSPTDIIGTKTYWPEWLDISLGTGANGLLRGSPSDQYSDPNFNSYPRYRQYYFSLDIDTRKLKIKNKTLRSILYAVSFIKVPAPTIEYNRGIGIKFYYLYF